MARRKNAPDQVRVKCEVAERLRDIRAELYGDRGGPELARRLGLPVRTWYNYEGGVTVPAEVILRLIEITRVEATWLLHGQGPKYRDGVAPDLDGVDNPLDSVESLLRTALKRLEGRESARAGRATSGVDDASAAGPDSILVRVEDDGRESLSPQSGPAYIMARKEWTAACRELRCLRVDGEAMAPLIPPGAYVAYCGHDVDPRALDDRLVVAWGVEDGPVVRWLHLGTRLAVLRAENPSVSSTAIDLESDAPRVRAVSWISTPR